MQVVCAQCHAVCDFDDRPEGASIDSQRCPQCAGHLALPALALQPEVLWLVLMPSGQAGPFSAAHMAQLFDQSNVDWTSLVWRQGLKGWRPARRDPQLITAVANARGSSAWGDTQRVSVRRSVLPATDTLVEAPARLPIAPRADPFAVAARGDWSDDHAADQSTQVAARARLPEATLADAFRSAPSIMANAAVFDPVAQPVMQRRSSPNSWLPSARSMSIVAVAAFGFGVLVAALWGRAQHVLAPRPATVLVRPTVATTEPLRASPPPAVPALDVSHSPAGPTREIPGDMELRREVKRVSPEVRRCIDDLSKGAEVEVYLDGATGHARDVRLRTPGLSPGRVECVTQAARQIQVDPFLRATHKFWHRFSY